MASGSLRTLTTTQEGRGLCQWVACAASAGIAAAQLLQQKMAPSRSARVDGSTIGTWQCAQVPSAASDIALSSVAAQFSQQNVFPPRVTIDASSMIVTSQCAQAVVDTLTLPSAPNGDLWAKSVPAWRLLDCSQEQSMTATGLKMTAEELLCLPDRGVRYELIAGELHEMPPAGGEHGFVGGRANRRRGAFLDQHPEVGGELFTSDTGFRLSRDPDTVRAADSAYVTAERLNLARVPGYPEMAPDLAVEVVSPNDTAREIQSKVEEWLRAGCRLVWVLYPQTSTATAYQPDGAARLLHTDDTLAGEPVLPGFACRVGELFGA